MQTHGGATAAAVIEGDERRIRARVEIDWNGNGLYDHPLSLLDDFVSEVSTDRALKGSAPEEILLVEGSSAAELSMTLGGEYNGMNLTSVFSRYNAVSPLYGRRTVGAAIRYTLIVETPLGEVEYPQFIGEVRTINPDRAEARVTISALDYVEKLRKPVSLPHWAMYSAAINMGETDSQVCWSHSVIDLCLRNCDVSPSPKRPTTRDEMNVPDGSLDAVHFFLPGNGSYLPAVGHVDNPRASTFPNRGKAMYTSNGPVHPAVRNEAQPTLGFFGVGTSNFNAGLGGGPHLPRYEGTLRYWCSNRDQMVAGGTHYFGLTLNNPSQIASLSIPAAGIPLVEVFTPSSRRLRITLTAQRTIVVQRSNGATGETVTSVGVAVPTSSGPVDVFVQVDQTTDAQVYIRCGANSTGGWRPFGSAVTYSYYKGYEDILGRIQVANVVDMSDVMYGSRNLWKTAPNRTIDLYREATYPAVLDRGLNRFSHIPNSKATEAWQIITDVAAAEFGSVFWDERGIFRFWNQDTLVQKQQTPVRAVSLDHLETLNMTDTLDSVRNVFIIDAKKKRAIDTKVAYKSSEIGEFETPARSVSRTTVWVDNILSPVTFALDRKQGYQGSVAGLPVWDDDTTIRSYVAQGYFNDVAGDDDGWFEDNSRLGFLWVNAYFDHEGFLVVRVDNQANNVPVRLSKGWSAADKQDSGACLTIDGTIIEDFPSQAFTVRNAESISRYGVKTLELSGDWYQDTYSTNNMITTLMQRTADPIPVTDSITIPGDPRIQLADTIVIQDAEGLGADLPAQILGIGRVFNDEGLKDTYTIEVLQPYDSGVPIPNPGGGDERVVRTNLATNPRCQFNENDYFSGRTESGRVGNVQGFPGTSTGYFATNEAVLPRADVQPGLPYTFSAYVMPSFTGTITFSLDWRQGENYYANAGTRDFAVTAGRLVRVSLSSSVPDSCDGAVPVLRYTGDAVVSQLLYEQSTSVGDYFDGNSVLGKTSWAGVEGNSISYYVVQEGSGGESPETPEGPSAGYTRRNLSPNPALGADAAGYYLPTNVTGARVTGLVGFERTTGFRVNARMTGGDGLSAPLSEELVAGREYTVSATIKCDGPDTLDGVLQVHCKGPQGAWIGSAGDAAFSIVPGDPVRVTTTFVAPAGIASMNPFVYGTTQPYTVTAWQYEETDVVRPYFDGDSSPVTGTVYSWEGTRFNSPSRMVFGDGGTSGGGTGPGTGGGDTGPAPANTAGSAALVRGWGTPVAWDVFNYTGQPNPLKWGVYGQGGSEGGDGKQCWLGHANEGRRCVEQATLNGQYLRLAMLPNGDQGGISHRYDQKYGRWEVRARTLPRAGSTGNPGHSVLIIWPTSNRWPEDGEYDFFEVNVGDAKAGAYMHYPHDPGVVQQEYNEKTGIDITQWHNYAFEWTPTALIGYIDGVEWFRRSGGATSTRRNIQDMPSGHLTMQIDGFFPNQTYQEGYLDVEWAKVYTL